VLLVGKVWIDLGPFGHRNGSKIRKQLLWTKPLVPVLVWNLCVVAEVDQIPHTKIPHPLLEAKLAQQDKELAQRQASELSSRDAEMESGKPEDVSPPLAAGEGLSVGRSPSVGTSWGISS